MGNRRPGLDTEGSAIHQGDAVSRPGLNGYVQTGSQWLCPDRVSMVVSRPGLNGCVRTGLPGKGGGCRAVAHRFASEYTGARE